ncbi:hypothetical protein JOF46_000268 [Paeniglutamicibacter psychrophenolicus]|uniref:Uncharacterized protein n=1 Tax=Paeniglutamicibacter psychrophenolicus TaxID=257454 RepID=A0ABS4W8K4_9MICC|nr:hypothetical protein [Paeniglutamicibacter psychrophenolicus]
MVGELPDRDFANLIINGMADDRFARSIGGSIYPPMTN